MAAKPPFNMLRAAFLLLATIIMVELAATMFAAVSCWWTNLTVFREVGVCIPVIQIIREQWTEMLSAILALLLAARSQPPEDKE